MSLPRIKLNIPNTNNNNNIETTNSTEERDPLIENSIILRVSNNLQQGLLSQSKDTNLIELLNYDDALTIQYFGLRKLVVIIDLNKLGLEGKEIYACELLDLPTITEVYKTTDLGKNMVKNGNITQVIYIYKKINNIEEVFSLQFDKICHDEVLLTSENPVDPIYNDFYEKEYNETLKMYESLKRLDFKNKKKYEQLIPTLIQNKENLVTKPTVSNSFYRMCKNGLTPPLHNVARRRQRKQLSLEEIQKLDFTLNRLVEKDMAAESVEFEFVSESEINDDINNHSINYGTPNYNSPSVDYNNQLKQSHSNIKNIVADGERDELKNKLKDVIQQQKPTSKNDFISDDEEDDGEEDEDEDDEEEEESDLEMELEKALLESPGSTTTSQINGKTEKVSSKNADSLESNTEDVDGLFSDDDNNVSKQNEKGNKTEKGNIAEEEDDDEEEEGDDDDDDELAGLLEELNSLQAVKQKNIKSFDSCKNQFMKERIMDRIKKIDKEISVLESKVRIVRGGGIQSSDDSEEEEEEDEEERDVEGEGGDGEKTDKTDGKKLVEDEEDDEDVDGLFSDEDDDEEEEEEAAAAEEEQKQEENGDVSAEGKESNTSEIERMSSVMEDNDEDDAEMMELFGGAADNDDEEQEENENNNDFMNQMNNNTDNANDDLDLDMLRGNSNDNKDNINNDNADEIDMSLFQ